MRAISGSRPGPSKLTPAALVPTIDNREACVSTTAKTGRGPLDDQCFSDPAFWPARALAAGSLALPAANTGRANSAGAAARRLLDSRLRRPRLLARHLRMG